MDGSASNHSVSTSNSPMMNRDVQQPFNQGKFDIQTSVKIVLVLLLCKYMETAYVFTIIQLRFLFTFLFISSNSCQNIEYILIVFVQMYIHMYHEEAINQRR